MAVAEGGDAMTDRPLPWFGAGQDPGPSFSELLARTMPEARRDTHGPEAASVGGGHEHVPHGTTIIAIHYAEGVVMAGDRRATSGLQIAGRRMEKLQAADSHSGVAIAGAAGPAMELVRLFQTELEHYEKIEGMPLSLDGKANHLARLIRGNLPAAMQGFVVVPLFAGYDIRHQKGRIFQYDVTGGRYEEIDFHATGSGSIHARNWIKATWRPDLPREEAVELAINALFNAADEDAATGGPDVVRGIYPQVATIDASGFSMLEDHEVEERTRALLERLQSHATGGED